MRLVAACFMTLAFGLFSVTSAIPVLKFTREHIAQLSPRRMAPIHPLAYVQDSSFPRETYSPEIRYPDIQTPLEQSHIKLIFLPVPGGDLDNQTTSANTRRIAHLISQFLNQSRYYHGLSSDNFTLINGWDSDGGNAIVEFRVEDDIRDRHCNPFCLGMLDVPYGTGDTIHGTLSQDQWQLHLDHAQSRILS
ncbi:hypothetical protein J3R30DRAFT_3444476 [Lentinula aciculospora]|uniref:Uncharacterized protein n=1 Tax=Lentinula aciculospora TaxID=153920 RepID=A0A9W9ANP7_9AGAR|nr:hypothetical protein J3R30DRAFT_3444476 [Lentinula aciculospora]